MGLIPKRKQPEVPVPAPQMPQVQQEQDESVWRVEQAVIQTEPVIFNSKEKKTYTLVEAMVEILNRTEE